jgi:ubiquinone biosynthesis protein
VVVEGVGRALDPRLDMWATAEPVVRTWIEANLGPLGKLKDAGAGLSTMARNLFALPDLMERGERLLSRIEAAAEEGFGGQADALQQMERTEARGLGWTVAALWVIALALVWMAVG